MKRPQRGGRIVLLGQLRVRSFSHTFNAPGSYTYICTLHSGMTGTIDVTDAPTLAVPEAPALAVAASVVAAIAGMLLWSRRGAARRVASRRIRRERADPSQLRRWART